MTDFIRIYLLKRQLERAIAARKPIGRARAQAAKQGAHTYWQRAGAKCRAMYGVVA